MSEVWEERQLTDDSWDGTNRRVYNVVGFSEWRAYDYTVSPYVYTDYIGLTGSAFSLTLNSGVSATDTTFSINAGTADAYEIPITGLLLQMGTGELCRIILATFVSGTTYTCLVERGSSGTTAASQSAGTISCLGRIHVTSLGQLGNQLIEVVCSNCSYQTIYFSSNSSNHNFKTGTYVSLPVNVPNPVYFTDGTSSQATPYYSYFILVTGPTTFVMVLANGTGPGTLGPSTAYPDAPSSYTLDPTSVQYTYIAPDIGYPVDFSPWLMEP